MNDNDTVKEKWWNSPCFGLLNEWGFISIMFLIAAIVMFAKGDIGTGVVGLLLSLWFTGSAFKKRDKLILKEIEQQNQINQFTQNQQN